MSKTLKRPSSPSLSSLWSKPRVLRSETTPYSDPGISFTHDPGKTDQSQSLECDVNQILARYKKTGVLPGVDVPFVFKDVSDSLSYQDALNLVTSAQSQFESLDAKTRKRFDNDPASFLQFVDDPKNRQELVKMGLAAISPQDPTDRVVEAIRASNAPSEAESPPSAGQADPKSPKKAKA